MDEDIINLDNVDAKDLLNFRNEWIKKYDPEYFKNYMILSPLTTTNDLKNVQTQPILSQDPSSTQKDNTLVRSLSLEDKNIPPTNNEKDDDNANNWSTFFYNLTDKKNLWRLLKSKYGIKLAERIARELYNQFRTPVGPFVGVQAANVPNQTQRPMWLIRNLHTPNHNVGDNLNTVDELMPTQNEKQKTEHYTNIISNLLDDDKYDSTNVMDYLENPTLLNSIETPVTSTTSTDLVPYNFANSQIVNSAGVNMLPALIDRLETNFQNSVQSSVVTDPIHTQQELSNDISDLEQTALLPAVVNKEVIVPMDANEISINDPATGTTNLMKLPSSIMDLKETAKDMTVIGSGGSTTKPSIPNALSLKSDLTQFMNDIIYNSFTPLRQYDSFNQKNVDFKDQYYRDVEIPLKIRDDSNLVPTVSNGNVIAEDQSFMSDIVKSLEKFDFIKQSPIILGKDSTVNDYLKENLKQLHRTIINFHQNTEPFTVGGDSFKSFGRSDNIYNQANLDKNNLIEDVLKTFNEFNLQFKNGQTNLISEMNNQRFGSDSNDYLKIIYMLANLHQLKDSTLINFLLNNQNNILRSLKYLSENLPTTFDGSFDLKTTNQMLKITVDNQIIKPMQDNPFLNYYVDGAKPSLYETGNLFNQVLTQWTLDKSTTDPNIVSFLKNNPMNEIYKIEEDSTDLLQKSFNNMKKISEQLKKWDYKLDRDLVLLDVIHRLTNNNLNPLLAINELGNVLQKNVTYNFDMLANTFKTDILEKEDYGLFSNIIQYLFSSLSNTLNIFALPLNYVYNVTTTDNMIGDLLFLFITYFIAGFQYQPDMLVQSGFVPPPSSMEYALARDRLAFKKTLQLSLIKKYLNYILNTTPINDTTNNLPKYFLKFLQLTGVMVPDISAPKDLKNFKFLGETFLSKNEFEEYNRRLTYLTNNNKFGFLDSIKKINPFKIEDDNWGGDYLPNNIWQGPNKNYKFPDGDYSFLKNRRTPKNLEKKWSVWSSYVGPFLKVEGIKFYSKSLNYSKDIFMKTTDITSQTFLNGQYYISNLGVVKYWKGKLIKAFTQKVPRQFQLDYQEKYGGEKKIYNNALVSSLDLEEQDIYDWLSESPFSKTEKALLLMMYTAMIAYNKLSIGALSIANLFKIIPDNSSSSTTPITDLTTQITNAIPDQTQVNYLGGYEPQQIFYNISKTIKKYNNDVASRLKTANTYVKEIIQKNTQNEVALISTYKELKNVYGVDFASELSASVDNLLLTDDLTSSAAFEIVKLFQSSPTTRPIFYPNYGFSSTVYPQDFLKNYFDLNPIDQNADFSQFDITVNDDEIIDDMATPTPFNKQKTDLKTVIYEIGKFHSLAQKSENALSKISPTIESMFQWAMNNFWEIFSMLGFFRGAAQEQYLRGLANIHARRPLRMGGSISSSSTNREKINHLKDLEKERVLNYYNPNVIDKYNKSKDLHNKLFTLVKNNKHLFDKYKMYHHHEDNSIPLNKVIDSNFHLKPKKNIKKTFKDFNGCDKCDKKKLFTDYYTNEKNIMCKTCLEGGKIINNSSIYNATWNHLKDSNAKKDEYSKLSYNEMLARSKSQKNLNSHDKFLSTSKQFFKNPVARLRDAYTNYNSFDDVKNPELLTLLLGHYHHGNKQTMNDLFMTNLNNHIINHLDDDHHHYPYVSQHHFNNFEDLLNLVKTKPGFLQNYLVS